MRRTGKKTLMTDPNVEKTLRQQLEEALKRVEELEQKVIELEEFAQARYDEGWDAGLEAGQAEF